MNGQASSPLPKRRLGLLPRLALVVGYAAVAAAQAGAMAQTDAVESSASDEFAESLSVSDLGLFSQSPLSGVPPEGWTAQFHPDIPRHTEFSWVEKDGERVLKIQSDAGYGTWVYAFENPAPVMRLSWTWRIDQIPQGADLKRKAGDDAAAKVCVFIDIDESRLGLGSRLALAAARTLSGENLPAATLCYVWSVQPYQGQIFANPYTDRVRNLVLREGPASSNWLLEQRDVYADAVAAFGNELPRVDGLPRVRLLGLALGADTDNTRSASLAWLMTLQIGPLSTD